MQKNKKINILNLSNIVYIIIIVCLSAFINSCEKREPVSQPEPAGIMKKIGEKFPENKELKEENITYESGKKSKELSEKAAANLYSDDKYNPVDLSKIEKYSIIKNDGNSAVEIGIFKLYDKTNSEYVKKMAQTRISKLQSLNSKIKNTDMAKITNDAEIRSYGNYVYYVSHPQKDKIFKIIEDALRGV